MRNLIFIASAVLFLATPALADSSVNASSDSGVQTEFSDFASSTPGQWSGTELSSGMNASNFSGASVYQGDGVNGVNTNSQTYTGGGVTIQTIGDAYGSVFNIGGANGGAFGYSYQQTLPMPALPPPDGGKG